MAVVRGEADCDGIPAVVKRHSVGEETLYAWKKPFGALRLDDVLCLKRHEQPNTRPKQLVAGHV